MSGAVLLLWEQFYNQTRQLVLFKSGAFHSTKISDNSSSNWMKQKVSRNRHLKILVNLSKLFFSEIWKFWKCPVPFGICTRYESAPVRLVMTESYKMSGSRHYLYDVSTSESFIACLSSTKKLGMLFSKIVDDWVFRVSSGHLPNGLHNLPREKSASFFVSRKLFSGLLDKVYLKWSRMRNKQLTALKTASSSLSSSNLSCKSWREMKVWMGNPHVGCQLKFHYFVSCRLKISTFVRCR